VQGDAKFMSIAAASVLAKPIATNIWIAFMRNTLCTTGKQGLSHQRASRSYKKIWVYHQKVFDCCRNSIVLIYNFMITIVHLLR
jgi:ribonuclease HII